MAAGPCPLAALAPPDTAEDLRSASRSFHARLGVYPGVVEMLRAHDDALVHAVDSLTGWRGHEKRMGYRRDVRCVSSISVPAAAKLFEIYGVDASRQAALLDLAKGARSRGWLKGFRGVVPPWFEDLVALERDASSIHELCIRTVPGLLQTERYARAVLSSGILGLDVNGLVDARMARATLLDRENPPEYWVVLCESVLQCQVGGVEVMREQLTHLADLAQRPNITIQVLPNEHGAHPSMTSPFTIVEFDPAPDFGVVYLDYLTGSLYRDDPAEVEQYHRAYRHLIKTALPEEPSLRLISARAKDLS